MKGNKSYYSYVGHYGHPYSSYDYNRYAKGQGGPGPEEPETEPEPSQEQEQAMNMDVVKPRESGKSPTYYSEDGNM
jgi:hypothetical protein